MSEIYVNSENLELEKPKDIILSIIIPVYGQSHFTKALLKDLMQLPANHEIIIVDNNSPDDTDMVVSKFLDQVKVSETPHLQYHRNPVNLFHSGGCNKGYKHANGKNILFLNNDVRVTGNYKEWTKELIQACNKNNTIYGMTVGTLSLVDFSFKSEKHSNNEIDIAYNELSLNRFVGSYLSGWCIAGNKETFDKLILNHYLDYKDNVIKEGKTWGCWDERFFYFNDPDLSWRARHLGIKLETLILPLLHIGKATAKTMNVNNLYIENKKIFTEIWKDKI